MENDVATGEQDEEGGEVVADEENVTRIENQVMEDIHTEVCDAEIKNGVLGHAIGGGKPAIRIGEDGPGAQKRGGSSMEEGYKAGGGFGSGLGAPTSENNEVS